MQTSGNFFSELLAPNKATYEKIFDGTRSEPLTWWEVRNLFREIADVIWQPNGDLKIVRNGLTLVLVPPPSRFVSSPEELSTLRHFLEQLRDSELLSDSEPQLAG